MHYKEAETYRKALLAYEKEQESYRTALMELDKEKAVLSAKLGALTLGKPIREVQALLEGQLKLREELKQAKAALKSAENHEATLRSVLKPVPAPETEDLLTYSSLETQLRLDRNGDALRTGEKELQQLSGQRRRIGRVNVAVL